MLGSYDSAQLSLSTTDGGTPLQPDDDIPAQNTAKSPLFIKEYHPSIDYVIHWMQRSLFIIQILTFLSW